jgi:molybdate transport system substrate-binding protein
MAECAECGSVSGASLTDLLPPNARPLLIEMTPRLIGISSMATRAVLGDLAADFTRRSGTPVAIESVGGVDAAKRVMAGEAFDVVVLASDAIDQLIEAGRVQAGSKVDLVCSGVAVAVKAGAPIPDIGTEAALRDTVLSARSIGCSTGPSGVQLLKLFERWGIATQVHDRLLQAPPGVPVGTLVAQGQVELGFQQLSELIHVDGLVVLGPMPAAVQISTTFSAGICAGTTQANEVRRLLDFMASAEADSAKKQHGMMPA